MVASTVLSGDDGRSRAKVYAVEKPTHRGEMT
jgi:hypothetical protein